jgi:hypothetical protein
MGSTRCPSRITYDEKGMEMIKRATLVLLVAALALFATGCSSLMSTTVEKPVLKPTFDNSHAILIEKAIKGLDVVSAVKNYVDQKEKLVVVSIETSTTSDNPVNYVIEDNLVSNLVGANFAVLERDENLLTRMLYEQGDRYQRVIPDAPSSQLLKGIEKYGMTYLNPNAYATKTGDNTVNLKETMDFFLKLSDFYKDMLSQVKVKNADVMVSYRVLECGIMVEKEEPKKGTATEEKPKLGDKNKAVSTNLLKVYFKREAMARLAIRVVDAKTGEVRYAGILENRVKDSLPFEQEQGQTEMEFRSNVAQYQDYLKDYHYTFYDQQLPNLRGTKQEQEEIVSQSQNTQTTTTVLKPQK